MEVVSKEEVEDKGNLTNEKEDPGRSMEEDSHEGQIGSEGEEESDEDYQEDDQDDDHEDHQEDDDEEDELNEQEDDEEEEEDELEDGLEVKQEEHEDEENEDDEDGQDDDDEDGQENGQDVVQEDDQEDGEGDGHEEGQENDIVRGLENVANGHENDVVNRQGNDEEEEEENGKEEGHENDEEDGEEDEEEDEEEDGEEADEEEDDDGAEEEARNDDQESDNSDHEEEDEIPLENGSNYLVRREDGQWYQSEILAHRTLEAEGQHSVRYQYYVHYKGLNRRLDEWVLRSRVMSENLDPDSPSSLSEILFPPENGVIDTKKLTRNQKRKLEEFYNLEAAVSELEIRSKKREKQNKDQIKYIDTIQFGRYEMGTWYASPYPEEYGKCRKLFICEFCLKYLRLEKSFCHHLGTCTQKGPLGHQIYRKDNLGVWEVDGKDYKVYCQNLCLLSKLFLDDKTLYFDVEPFLFYILCEIDRKGAHIVGYFSKEKESPDGYNLSCILTLPPFQRKGYGKFLISFSYQLSKLEKTIGTPEQPLSDLGLLSYRSYWSYVLLETLLKYRGLISMKDLCNNTAIAKSDIIATLKSLNLIKYWKNPQSLSITPSQILESAKLEGVTSPILQVDESCLNWTPPPKKI